MIHTDILQNEYNYTPFDIYHTLKMCNITITIMYTNTQADTLRLY